MTLPRTRAARLIAMLAVGTGLAGCADAPDPAPDHDCVSGHGEPALVLRFTPYRQWPEGGFDGRAALTVVDDGRFCVDAIHRVPGNSAGTHAWGQLREPVADYVTALVQTGALDVSIEQLIAAAEAEHEETGRNAPHMGWGHGPTLEVDVRVDGELRTQWGNGALLGVARSYEAEELRRAVRFFETVDDLVSDAGWAFGWEDAFTTWPDGG